MVLLKNAENTHIAKISNLKFRTKQRYKDSLSEKDGHYVLTT